MMLSGSVSSTPVRVSEPLDPNAVVAAPEQQLDDVRCFNRRGGGAIGALE